jgi:S-adenosylmethionine/arginine decarboxylase-like enzyme
MGKHLIINSEGSRCSRILDSIESIYRYLEDIVSLVDMTVLIPPHVVRCRDIGNEGVTGFVVITTSHASIHTWPDTGSIRFDLFSCRDFDTKFIIEEYTRRFSPAIIETEILDR